MILRPLSPLDFQELKPFVLHQKYRLCYYSLPSILTWCNEFYKPYGAIEGNTLFLGTEYSEETENRHLMLPLSPEEDYPPETLRDLAVSLGFDKYRYVSEEYLDTYDRCRIDALFRISEQEESEDYLYLTEDLSGLKGNKFSKKRNLVNQFQREYVNRDRVTVEPITSSSSKECIDFMSRWYEESHLDIDNDVDLICEREAIIQNLAHIDLLETRGILLRIDGDVCAFGIGGHITDDTAALPYEKAYPRIKGLYQYFDKLCAEKLFEGYTYINKESDMGVPGIAKAKKSYRPVKRVKAYELKLPAASGR